MRDFQRVTCECDIDLFALTRQIAARRKSSSSLVILPPSHDISSVKHTHQYNHIESGLESVPFAGMCLSIASCVIRIAVWRPKKCFILFSLSRALACLSNNPHLQFFGCCRPIQTIVARTSRRYCGGVDNFLLN